LLQKLFNEVIKDFDCVVLEGRRGKADQEKALRGGFSNAHFGDSAHNYTPAIALDVCPYPVNWENRKAFIALSKVVLAKAKALGVPIRWGGDWDGDGNMKDQTLMDLPHYELNPWRTYAAKSKLYRG
jgi:peptidoglycan L-alanyl-D-glutamate endopeptidase CwlK